ncbi:hypothetical protein [Liquorilactobacillus satsumensis]|uniref:hypothetical protein n=1 Tax=Liquorilactobacillus satsumensis TaxID=259059 RepID=UPI0039E76613
MNVISAENLALQFMKTQDKIVFFSSLTKQKEYRLVYYNDLVKMTGADGGYLPLLYDVSQFDAVFHDNLLVIDATMQKRKYHCEIVMGKKE